MNYRVMPLEGIGLPIMPDPKLQTAMEEIKVVLCKHDIAAVVLLASQTHMEYLHELSPSWSCAKFEQAITGGGFSLRMKAVAQDFPSQEAHKKCLEDSVGIVMGFLDALGQFREQYMHMAKMIMDNVEFDHVTRHEPPATYVIDANGQSITCLRCHKTSNNPNDVAQKYCGFCHVFHEGGGRS